MVRHAGSVAAALLTLCANLLSPVGAEEEKIKRITPTDADSACIGNPITLLCAVETWIACFTREDLSLCRAVGQDYEFFKPTGGLWAAEYVIERMHKIRPEDITEELKDTDWKPGYFDIVVRERFCALPQTTCLRKTWSRFYYHVKPVGRLWHIVSSYEEGAGS